MSDADSSIGPLDTALGCGIVSDPGDEISCLSPVNHSFADSLPNIKTPFGIHLSYFPWILNLIKDKPEFICEYEKIIRGPWSTATLSCYENEIRHFKKFCEINHYEFL